MARIECPRCLRPLKTCYCKALTPETACIDLLIIQHPSETRHPVNSARIASLGISNCEILVGRRFHRVRGVGNAAGKPSCLPVISIGQCVHHKDVHRGNNTAPTLCVILDGTWRKAKKIYYMNPVLQALPAITLSDTYTSAYTIRKNTRSGGVIHNRSNRCGSQGNQSDT